MIMQYMKVEGHMNLVRDEETKAVINVSKSDYEKYIEQKNIKEKEGKRINLLEIEVADIKTDIKEIKNLLHQVITRL